MHFGTKTCIFMLFSAVLASALRSRENENGCREITTSLNEALSSEVGSNNQQNRDQDHFRYNRRGAMDSSRPIFGERGGDDYEQGRAFERLASLAKYARSKLPFTNQRSRTAGETNRPCNKQ
uniref:Putative conserved secreted protein n=1 Tax=Rhipicephalus microplus TaxID=6941 RepID=A0A6G5A2R0_RHIMP